MQKVPMTHTNSDEQRLLRIMYIGMALTAALMVAPLVDLFTADTIYNHVHATYPHWPDRMIHEDRDAIVGWLAGVGLLGTGAWYWSIRAVRRHSRRMRIVVTSAFSLGLLVALLNLSTGGHGYEQVVPLPYGLLSLVPTAVGLVAAVRVWRPVWS
ncbi:MAG TPA: hypothetical protein VE442_13665 [Jatrophihabitans sp.]|nr:hypothetical protein [Jatrophihabitans sp.]